MRLRLASGIPSARPAGWPDQLPWSPEWREVLDPDRPLTCLVYPDGRSSQWNEFEAQAVASLALLLSRHALRDLGGVLTPQGGLGPATGDLHDPASFWSKGIGIVTPHRAQQGLVVGKLESLFAGTAHL
jgi:hypothetical protein